MIKIYHNPRCSKSRQGLAILEESGKAYEIVKYLENEVDVEQLKTIISKLGIKPIDLVRKNEAIWKSNYKGKSLSDKEPLLDNTPKVEPLIENSKIINEFLNTFK